MSEKHNSYSPIVPLADVASQYVGEHPIPGSIQKTLGYLAHTAGNIHHIIKYTREVRGHIRSLGFTPNQIANSARDMQGILQSTKIFVKALDVSSQESTSEVSDMRKIILYLPFQMVMQEMQQNTSASSELPTADFVWHEIHFRYGAQDNSRMITVKVVNVDQEGINTILPLSLSLLQSNEDINIRGSLYNTNNQQAGYITPQVKTDLSVTRFNKFYGYLEHIHNTLSNNYEQFITRRRRIETL